MAGAGRAVGHSGDALGGVDWVLRGWNRCVRGVVSRTGVLNFGAGKGSWSLRLKTVAECRDMNIRKGRAYRKPRGEEEEAAKGKRGRTDVI